MHIVLLEPEIPQNTGNIARTCSATGSGLHLIKPLGFSLDDKYLKRAGMDYWQEVEVKIYENFEQFIGLNQPGAVFMATTKAQKTYVDVSYPQDAYIMFGKESAGIPEELLLDYKDTAVRIPMAGQSRSLNLSNAVAVVLYEALRQHQFQNLLLEGQLHRNHWE